MKVEVEAADDGVGIVDGDWPDISQRLDLGRHLLDLIIGHLQTELANSRLDGVPASETRGKVDVAGQTEISRVENLVGAGVVEDGLGVDTGLVGKGAETGDGVVEGSVDLDGLGDEILELLELVELVLALDILRAGDDHASHQATKRGDTIALTNAENTGINVGSTGLESTVGVGDTAAGIVVEVGLDVAGHDASEGADKVVDLPGGSATDGIGDTDTVDTDLVDGAVEGEEVDEIRTERVLAGDCRGCQLLFTPQDLPEGSSINAVFPFYRRLASCKTGTWAERRVRK